METDRVDERTIMFSRAELVPGTERYETYYREHPEHLPLDLKFRGLPGLLNPSAPYFQPLIFAAAEAAFFTTGILADRVDGEVNPERTDLSSARVLAFIRQWARDMGVHSIGVTSLKAEHLYSVGGRKRNYGNPVSLSHTKAIVFTVEMDHRRVSAAPRAPIILESSYQYLHAGTIAVQIASMLRNLGFSARAHIDSNYLVRCPQIARDAGLGEIGRMSLLMTPRLGPRVRIGVVTTELDLPENIRKEIPGLRKFCELCKKCADNCPAGAISSEPGTPGRDWYIDQTACYTYWCTCGTDCGRCVSVCPYAHKDNLIHNSIRWIIGRIQFLQRIALYFDHLIYGKAPSLKKLPEWM